MVFQVGNRLDTSRPHSTTRDTAALHRNTKFQHHYLHLGQCIRGGSGICDSKSDNAQNADITNTEGDIQQIKMK